MYFSHISFFIFFLHSSLFGLDLATSLKDEFSTPKVRILLGLDDLSARNKKLDSLRADLAAYEQLYQKTQPIMQAKIVHLKSQIAELEASFSRKDIGLAHKKIHILQKLLAACLQIPELQDKVVESISINIEFWEKYFRDMFPQSQIVQEKSLYSFADFMSSNAKIFIQQEALNQLRVQQEALSIVMNREEQLLSMKDAQIIHIDELIQDKKKHGDINKDDMEICDLEKELALKEHEIASLTLSVYQREIDYLKAQEIVVREKLTLFNQHIKHIRSYLYVDMSDIDFYLQKYEEIKIKNSGKNVSLLKQRHDITNQKIQAQHDLDRLRIKFKVKIYSFKQIEDFELSSRSSSENFAFFSAALAYARVVSYERILQAIKAEMLFEQVKEDEAHLTYQAVKLLHDVLQGKSKDSQTFEKEHVLYQNKQQSLQQTIKNNKEEIIVLQNHIRVVQQLIAHMLIEQEKIKNNMSVGSAAMQKKSSENIILIEELIKQLEQQYATISDAAILYEHMVTYEEKSLQHVSLILSEMHLVGVWHRSMSAVTWEGIKNILPNLAVFTYGISKIIGQYASIATIQSAFKALSKNGIFGFLALFFWVLIIIVLYVSLRALLPVLYKSLLRTDVDDTESLYKLRQIVAVSIGFLIDVFKPFYFWTLCLMYELFATVPVGFLIVFYIFSIIFWIYASRRLLLHFIVVNRKFDYGLLAKRLIERFSKVYIFFATSTIVILVLRKMLIVVLADQPTELPNILLRVYHIVIFISIIFSLDKEEILHILPKKTSLQQRWYYLVDMYFYMFLLAFFTLLVLSDPYLGGYGILIWHIGWNLFLTVSILVGMYIVYTLIKKHSNFLFFTHCQSVGGISERFDYAKTWYAIYIIGLILFIAVLSATCVAYVWGYPVTLHMFRKIAMYELFKIETLNSLGKATPESFRLFNLLYILIMTCAGVIFAYLFKRLVLERVFDIQYVDPGIQNTIIIISRYVIIIVAIMIACIQSKLGFVVTYVSFVGLATFGWSFKDLFTDFVAYFFILVQRPLKLGDYVKINDDTMGVVRKIGPRAVILRRRNAVNIVVPNSTVLKNAMYNWNYVRSYIGFDDIMFTVPFGTDIILVKEVCFKVLDADNDVLKVPQPFVRLQDFSDKGYVFMVRGFLSSGNTLRQWDITSNIRFALVLELSKVGISIAGPTCKITMHKDAQLNHLDF